MAIALHRPNCVSLSPSIKPKGGKINKAKAFRMKTVPIAMLICFSLAPLKGATAAIALPPQIAVPADIKKDMVESSLISLRRK